MATWVVTFRGHADRAATDAELLRLAETVYELKGVAGGGANTLGGTIDVEAPDPVTAAGTAAEILRGFKGWSLSYLEVMTPEQQESELAAPRQQLVGIAEIAEMIGATKQWASELAAQDRFPKPLERLNSGPVWDRSHVEGFLDYWNRKPGRKATSEMYDYIEKGYRAAAAAQGSVRRAEEAIPAIAANPAKPRKAAVDPRTGASRQTSNPKSPRSRRAPTH